MITFGPADGDLETTFSAFFAGVVVDGPRDIADECRYERGEHAVLHSRAVHSKKNGRKIADLANSLFLAIAHFTCGKASKSDRGI